MYFDIQLIQEPDENGNLNTSYRRITVAPDYPDIKPSDMSTTNQQKAGLQLDKVKNFSKGDNLRKSDSAESSMIDAINSIPDQEPTLDPTPEPPSDPTPEPSN